VDLDPILTAPGGVEHGEGLGILGAESVPVGVLQGSEVQPRQGSAVPRHRGGRAARWPGWLRAGLRTELWRTLPLSPSQPASAAAAGATKEGSAALRRKFTIASALRSPAPRPGSERRPGCG
jgi:hypothetical protein